MPQPSEASLRRRARKDPSKPWSDYTDEPAEPQPEMSTPILANSHATIPYSLATMHSMIESCLKSKRFADIPQILVHLHDGIASVGHATRVSVCNTLGDHECLPWYLERYSNFKFLIKDHMNILKSVAQNLEPLSVDAFKGVMCLLFETLSAFFEDAQSTLKTCKPLPEPPIEMEASANDQVPFRKSADSESGASTFKNDSLVDMKASQLTRKAGRRNLQIDSSASSSSEESVFSYESPGSPITSSGALPIDKFSSQTIASASSSTLVSTDQPIVPLTSRQGNLLHLLETPNGQRVSWYCPPIDSESTEIQLPLPSVDKADLHALFSTDGRTLYRTTFHTLIRLQLTTPLAVDPDISKTFWLCFPWFTSPAELITALESWFNDPTQDLKMDLSSEPGWSLVKGASASQRRLRIGRLVLSWLQSWDIDRDNGIIDRVCLLISRFQGHTLSGKLDLALEKILTAATDERRPSTADSLSPSQIIPTSKSAWQRTKPNELLIPMMQTRGGVVMFSQQLCLMFSNILMNVDISRAIRKWVDNNGGPGSCKEPKYTATPEEFIALKNLTETVDFWVTNSLIHAENEDKGRAFHMFWLDVVTVCIRCGNFSAAHAVWSGIFFVRLRKTMRDLPENYKDLHAMFDSLFTKNSVRGPSEPYPTYPRGYVQRREIRLHPSRYVMPSIYLLVFQVSFLLSNASISPEGLLPWKTYSVFTELVGFFERSQEHPGFVRDDSYAEKIEKVLKEQGAGDLEEGSGHLRTVMQTFLDKRWANPSSFEECRMGRGKTRTNRQKLCLRLEQTDTFGLLGQLESLRSEESLRARRYSV